MKIYIGYKAGHPMEIFKYESRPTPETHGDRFPAVVGPFRTMRGARFMAIYGSGNPHCQCVADAERLGKLLGC